jgi:phosphoserine phosphatase RsbU/P
MPAPYLRWQTRRGRPETHRLKTAETLIGRRTDADIVLNHAHVSRNHAKVVQEGNQHWIIDLGSSHGTFVNGERVVERRLLHPGDRIGLGDEKIEMVYQCDEAAATAEAWIGDELQNSIENLASLLPAKGSGVSELAKISYILDFHYFWEKRFSPERMFEHILKSALEISGAERGFIAMKNPAGGFRYQVGLDSKGKLLPDAEFRTSQSVVRQVAEQRKPVFMTGGIEGELAQRESIVALKLRAVACLPLEAISAHSDSPEVVGILYLDSTRQMHALSGMDQKIMRKLAEEAGNVVEKLEIIKSYEERTKMEQELALAEETQRSLLPRATPSFEGFRVRTFNQPTRYVGGDFFDFLERPESAVAGVLADVSGKGISAALLSALVQGALHMEFSFTPQPEVVLKRLNQFLYSKTIASRFVTLFLFLLDPQGKGQYVNAGHNPPYLYRAASGGLEELTQGGMILGAFNFATYQAEPFELRPGDVLVVFSDGLTDAENQQGEAFGEERLRRLILQDAPRGAAALERGLLDSIHDFTQGRAQTDDITFLLVEKCP